MLYFNIAFRPRLDTASREFDAMGVLEETVENHIRDGRLTDGLVPVRHRQLAGDHGRV